MSSEGNFDFKISKIKLVILAYITINHNRSILAGFILQSVKLSVKVAGPLV